MVCIRLQGSKFSSFRAGALAVTVLVAYSSAMLWGNRGQGSSAFTVQHLVEPDRWPVGKPHSIAAAKSGYRAVPLTADEEYQGVVRSAGLGSAAACAILATLATRLVARRVLSRPDTKRSRAVIRLALHAQLEIPCARADSQQQPQVVPTLGVSAMTKDPLIDLWADSESDEMAQTASAAMAGGGNVESIRAAPRPRNQEWHRHAGHKRQERRRVGARLQAAKPVAERRVQSYDPTRVRLKVQNCIRLNRTNRVGSGREAKQASASSESVGAIMRIRGKVFEEGRQSHHR